MKTFCFYKKILGPPLTSPQIAQRYRQIWPFSAKNHVCGDVRRGHRKIFIKQKVFYLSIPGYRSTPPDQNRVFIEIDTGYCWDWMKKQLRNEQNITTIAELEEAITRLWTVRMADSDYLRSLVESMPRRLAEVIERGGNPTKY